MLRGWLRGYAVVVTPGYVWLGGYGYAVTCYVCDGYTDGYGYGYTVTVWVGLR